METTYDIFSVYTGINTFETIWESLWKKLMTYSAYILA